MLKKLKVKGQAKLNVVMVLVAWVSLLFIGKKDIKRFFPATILILFIEIFTSLLGKRNNWWIFFNKPHSYWFNEFPIQLGPVLASSFWMLKLGAGHFKRFFTLNLFLHLIFIAPITMLAKKKKYFIPIRLNNLQFFFYFFPKAFIFYGVQKLFDKYYKPVE